MEWLRLSRNTPLQHQVTLVWTIKQVSQSSHSLNRVNCLSIKCQFHRKLGLPMNFWRKLNGNSEMWLWQNIGRWVSAGEAASVSERWLLPGAGRVEVRVWACREERASHAAPPSCVWGWRMSGAEKSAHTRSRLSSPLCPRGASRSWKCLPPPACTRFNTCKDAWVDALTRRWHIHTGTKALSPVRVEGAGVPGQAHVVLHLQSSVLLLLTDVFSFQLVLSLHHAPQHLQMDTFYIMHTQKKKGESTLLLKMT